MAQKIAFEKWKKDIEKIANIDKADRESAVKVITELEQIFNAGAQYMAGRSIAPKLAEAFRDAIYNHKPNRKTIEKLAGQLAAADKKSEKANPQDSEGVVAREEEKLLSGANLNKLVAKRIAQRASNIAMGDKQHRRKGKSAKDNPLMDPQE